MEFPSEVLTKIIIFVLGVCGFMVAQHIRKHKTKNTPLVCPVGFDCHGVVHSDYSRFMGMRVEVLGMVYYAFISLVYLLLIFVSNALPSLMMALPIVLSSVAFLFSIYLIYIQLFVLKKGCSWCIVSSIISALIFILTFL